MSTSNLSARPELVIQSRKAAYCARRRLDSPHLTTQDMEDMAQAAALVYWKQHREGRSPAFCFVCARNAAEKYFFRTHSGQKSPQPLVSRRPHARWR